MISIFHLSAVAALIFSGVVFPRDVSAQELPKDASQDLSLSVGKADFIKLPNSERTKPNFLDMGLDMLLQKALEKTAQNGLEMSYSFLEFIPSDKTVVLTNFKIDSACDALKGKISFGTLKIGVQDFINSLKKHSLAFSQINVQDARIDLSSFARGEEKERLKGYAKTFQITHAVYGPCAFQDFEKTISEKPEDVTETEGRCLTAQQVFAADGYLTRVLKKQKYVLKEGLINGFLLKLDAAENPLVFSIGNVNGTTVRTSEELFQVLKKLKK